jgi:hypothetical protein
LRAAPGACWDARGRGIIHPHPAAAPAPQRRPRPRRGGRRDDGPDPVVTEHGEWGPWVDGGAWLRVRGRRIDLLYRSVERVERVLAQAQQGEYEIHYGQQPPYGYFGPTVLGEIAICRPLRDPERRLSALASRVLAYPEPLRRAVVQDALWAVEFGLAFAEKFAARGDPYGVTGCAARFMRQLVLALFALNRTYLLSDKTALDEIDDFSSAPPGFSARVRGLLGHPGTSVEELEASVSTLAALFREVAASADGLYRPRYTVPR